jgi:hypothetical protein
MPEHQALFNIGEDLVTDQGGNTNLTRTPLMPAVVPVAGWYWIPEGGLRLVSRQKTSHQTEANAYVPA